MCTCILCRSTTSETTEEQPPEQQAATTETSNPVIQAPSDGGGGDLIGDLLSLDLPTQPTYTAPVANVGQYWASIGVA